jgi:hypothetical protein
MYHGSVFADIVFGAERDSDLLNEELAMSLLCDVETLARMKTESNLQLYYDDYRTFLYSLSSGFSWRDFVVTKGGYMGRGRRGVEPGDLVCIAYGCNLPLIARRCEPAAGDGLVMVGEAFIEGMLDGEMVKRVGGEFMEQDLLFV